MFTKNFSKTPFNSQKEVKKEKKSFSASPANLASTEK
jgi:hypothetical protein